MRPRIASASSCVDLPFSTARESCLVIFPTALSSAAWSTSRSTTSYPAVAVTCAIPCPMRPPPTTPTFLISAIYRTLFNEASLQRVPRRVGDLPEGQERGDAGGAAGRPQPRGAQIERRVEVERDVVAQRAGPAGGPGAVVARRPAAVGEVLGDEAGEIEVVGVADDGAGGVAQPAAGGAPAVAEVAVLAG